MIAAPSYVRPFGGRLGWRSFTAEEPRMTLPAAAHATHDSTLDDPKLPDPFTLQPLRYQPSFEFLEEDEERTGEALVAAMRGISEKVLKDEGHAYRSVHAKSHGLLLGEMEVLDKLPPAYAQGVFSQPGRYPAVMRLSTIPGDLLHDAVSTPRGFALKLVGVPGDRVPGSEGDTTQDFLMVDSPNFSAKSARQFLRSVKLVAATTDRLPSLKQALSVVLRGLERWAEKADTELNSLKALGAHPPTHPLGDRYYGQLPVLWGPYMAKFCLVPVDDSLLALRQHPVDLDAHHDALRLAVEAHFAREGGAWELRVQLCTDLARMPLEDPSEPWSEVLSPYVPVAMLRAGPQPGWSRELSVAIDDGMSFSPWHALAAHRPLGAIMRIRQAAYRMAAEFRAAHNPTPVVEPRSLAALKAVLGEAGQQAWPGEGMALRGAEPPGNFSRPVE
ncbi:catalase family protein [Ideonella azotifigens]|uniref:Catalase family protein n=2 Tax=Ideonella azotifigens TaxID=513160 RepID=A0ABP3VTN3_9BURK